MVLDKEDHRTILLELIDKAAFPGSAVDTVKELRDTIRAARLEQPGTVREMTEDEKKKLRLA